MPIFSHRDASKLNDLCATVYKEQKVRDDLRFSQLLLQQIATMNVLEEITESIRAGSVEKPRSAPFLIYTRAFAEGSDEDVLKAVEEHWSYAKRKETSKFPNKDTTAYCYETVLADLGLLGLPVDRLIQLGHYSGGKPVRKFFKKDSIIIDMLNAMLGEGFRVKKEEEMVASMGYGDSSVTLFEVRLSVEFTGSYSPKDIALVAGVNRFSSVGRAIQDLPDVTLGFSLKDDYEKISVLWPETLYPHWLNDELGSAEIARMESECCSSGAFDVDEFVTHVSKADELL